MIIELIFFIAVTIALGAVSYLMFSNNKEINQKLDETIKSLDSQHQLFFRQLSKSADEQAVKHGEQMRELIKLYTLNTEQQRTISEQQKRINKLENIIKRIKNKNGGNYVRQ